MKSSKLQLHFEQCNFQQLIDRLFAAIYSITDIGHTHTTAHMVIHHGVHCSTARMHIAIHIIQLHRAMHTICHMIAIVHVSTAIWTNMHGTRIIDNVDHMAMA